MLVAALVGVAAVGLLDIALAQLGSVLDVVGLRYVPGTVCYDPVSLGCLLSDGGAAAAGLAAAAAADNGQPGVAPTRAPETPAAYNPPPGQTGYDAINDPAFEAQRDQHARDHSDTTPLPPPPGLSERLMGGFWGSVRESYGRQ